MTSKVAVVHTDPDILGGTPVFVGTRVPAQTLFDYLEGGETLDEFLHQSPSVNGSRPWPRSRWPAIPSWPMRVLLDENVPVDLAGLLVGHAPG